MSRFLNLNITKANFARSYELPCMSLARASENQSFFKEPQY